MEVIPLASILESIKAFPVPGSGLPLANTWPFTKGRGSQPGVCAALVISDILLSQAKTMHLGTTWTWFNVQSVMKCMAYNKYTLHSYGLSVNDNTYQRSNNFFLNTWINSELVLFGSVCCCKWFILRRLVIHSLDIRFTFWQYKCCSKISIHSFGSHAYVVIIYCANSVSHRCLLILVN